MEVEGLVGVNGSCWESTGVAAALAALAGSSRESLLLPGVVALVALAGSMHTGVNL